MLDNVVGYVQAGHEVQASSYDHPTHHFFIIHQMRPKFLCIVWHWKPASQACHIYIINELPNHCIYLFCWREGKDQKLCLIARFVISKPNRIIPKQRENTYSGSSPNGHSRKRKALLTAIFTKRRFPQQQILYFYIPVSGPPHFRVPRVSARPDNVRLRKLPPYQYRKTGVVRNKLWHKVGEVGATLKNPLVEGMNVFLHAGMNLSNRSQIKNRKTRHFRLVCFLKHWQSLHKSTQSQYLKLRDWPKSMWGRGGGPEQRGGG